MESKSLPLSRLQSNLTCSICQGYLIDATTITECMHTFCKSCLLQRVESGRTFCPKCGVQLQRSRLGEQLKLDHAVQALVYAAVPGLWQEEQRRRKHFVDHHPLSTSVAPPLQHPTCFSPSDPISLSLDFIPQSRDEYTSLNFKGPNSPQTIGRRFFRCPAAVAVHHFQKLLCLKFELPPQYMVEIYCQGEKLAPAFRLMDVAYKTGWTQEEPLRLEYKIIKNQPTKVTSLIATTGSTANNISQSQQWRSKTSSTEVGGNTGAHLKRSSAPPPTAPPKQQKLSLSIRRPGLRNQLEESPTREEEKDPTPEPIRRSSKKSCDATDSSPSSKKRGRKKKRKRKSSDLVPIMEPLHPLKVKIVERVKSAEYLWSRPNGVELLVKAAELASRQNPTPPPPVSQPDEPIRPRSPPPLLPISVPVINSNTGDSVNNNGKPTIDTTITTTPEVEEEEEEDSQQLTVGADDDMEDDGKLMIADEMNLNGSSSNGRDSGMANDEDDDDSAGALDLSSKSSRNSPPDELTNKQPAEPAKSVSPQLIQQRSTALHSITDSLAQRQRQRLIQQQQQEQQRRVPVPTQHSGAMRNLATIPQSIATPTLANHHQERAATQRLIVAMHQFAAAAAAAAASAPPRHPTTAKPTQPSKPLSYGLLRRPF